MLIVQKNKSDTISNVTDKRYVSLIYHNFSLGNMVITPEAYRLTCVCGHDFIEHVGSEAGFPCKLQDKCVCNFYRLQKSRKRS